MKFVDIHEFREKTSSIIDSLQEENVVLTEKGKPVALIQKFDEQKISNDAINHIIHSNKNMAAQYPAMLAVWGDPQCDVYDEAFMDE